MGKELKSKQEKRFGSSKFSSQNIWDNFFQTSTFYETISTLPTFSEAIFLVVSDPSMNKL
jgi:hypothetical protein